MRARGFASNAKSLKYFCSCTSRSVHAAVGHQIAQNTVYVGCIVLVVVMTYIMGGFALVRSAALAGRQAHASMQ